MELTFEELCELEPRLLELYREAKAVVDDRADRGFCANAVWYGYGRHSGLKRRLVSLVGFEAGYPEEPPYSSDPPKGKFVFLTLPQLMALSLDDVPRREVDPRLKMMEAYDLAYDTIYDVLPDCRNCNCVHVEAVENLSKTGR